MTDDLLPKVIAAENVERLLDGVLTAPPHEGTLAERVFRELSPERRAALIGQATPRND